MRNELKGSAGTTITHELDRDRDEQGNPLNSNDKQDQLIRIKICIKEFN